MHACVCAVVKYNKIIFSHVRARARALVRYRRYVRTLRDRETRLPLKRVDLLSRVYIYAALCLNLQFQS